MRGAMISAEHLRRLEAIVEHTTNMVVVTNRRREIEWVNAAYTEITGWTLPEVRGRNPRSFLHGPRTSLAAASRLSHLLRQGATVNDFELLNYKKSGEPYWVSLNIRPIRDDRGEIAEYVAIQTDITERKRRELELLRSHRQLAEAQRLAKLGAMEHDLSTGTVHCSAEACAVLDIDSEVPVSLALEVLLLLTHHADAAPVRTAYTEAVNSGRPFESEHRIVTRAGRTKWVFMRGELDGWDDGSPAVFRVAVQDITERKAAERLERENEVLEQVSRSQMEVLARVSHELRTPLHAVLGFSEILLGGEGERLSPRARGHLQQVLEAARHQLRIVNDILDLAHLHRRGIVAERSAVDLLRVADQVVTMLEPLASERSVTIASVPPGGPVLARGDLQRLRQVLINLVANAIKFNRPGGRVELRFGPAANGTVSVAVHDTGPGIAQAQLPRIFEPFYRAGVAAASGRRAEAGGLGLAICRMLVQEMEGTIRVDSTEGVGSVFVVTLPRAQPAPVAVTRGAASGSDGHLLCIDGSEADRAPFDRYLEEHHDLGLSWHDTAASGLEAARVQRPRVILIDTALPDMAPAEVLRRIQADPSLHRVPCVAVSADGRDEAVAAAVRQGFRACLKRPLDAGELNLVLDRLLSDDTPSTRW